MKKLLFGMAILLAAGVSCNQKAAKNNADDTDSIRINCMIEVSPENRDKVIELSKELVSASLMDLGNLDYDIYESATDPTKLMIFETWEGQSNLDEHSAAEHFTTIVPQLQELATKMDVQTFKKGDINGLLRVNCTMDVAEEDMDTIFIMTKELIEASRADEGNVDYDLYVSSTDPRRLLIFETWESPAALEKHSAAEHFTRIVPAIQAVTPLTVESFAITKE